MMEVITFFFTDFWHFAGLCVVISLIVTGATSVAAALPRKV